MTGTHGGVTTYTGSQYTGRYAYTGRAWYAARWRPIQHADAQSGMAATANSAKAHRERFIADSFPLSILADARL
jgi:hypothetical protein